MASAMSSTLENAVSVTKAVTAFGFRSTAGRMIANGAEMHPAAASLGALVTPLNRSKTYRCVFDDNRRRTTIIIIIRIIIRIIEFRFFILRWWCQSLREEFCCGARRSARRSIWLGSVFVKQRIDFRDRLLRCRREPNPPRRRRRLVSFLFVLSPANDCF